MNGPSPLYLAQLNAALNGSDIASLTPPMDPYAPRSPGPVPPAPPPPMAPPPAPTPYQPNPGLPGYQPNAGLGPAVASQPETAKPRLFGGGAPSPTTPTPPQAPAVVEGGDVESWGDLKGPAPTPAQNASGSEQADDGEPMPYPVESQMVSGGGVTPAREVPLRGPTQNAYLERSFEHPLAAADRIEARSNMAAQHEAAAYDSFAEDALKQREAMQRVAARREQEMSQLRANYADTIQQLGSMKIDQDRTWANSSTPEKITTTALMFLSGVFSQGVENKFQTAINKKIEDDVKLQMFDYQKGKDIANGQQTAFGMAMQQYGNEDAAYHAAMAAGQQYVAARVGSLNAEWKGIDASNQADTLRAHFSMAADQSIANGFKYLQPVASAPQYRVAVLGHMLPAPVSGTEANRIALEHEAKPNEAMDMAFTKGGIDLAVQDQKQKAEAAAKGKEHAVQLPSGEVVNVGSPKTEEDLRAAVLGHQKTQRLVNEAKAIRQEAVTGVPLDLKARGRLKQIQSDLVTNFGVQNKLGALSDKDMELAVGGTADLFEMGPGPAARLDRLTEQSSRGLNEYVATIPGASPKAQGKLPSSFTAHGKK